MSSVSPISTKGHVIRVIWWIISLIFFKPFPRSMGSKLKAFILNCFGAKISYKAKIYSSANIYFPCNLIMEDFSCIGPNTDIYNVDMIVLKEKALISQKSYICTASHDYKDGKFPLIIAPVVLEKNSWVAADAFVGMGVTIGENAIVGVRASVFKDVAKNSIVGGNPAKFIKNRF